jgi:hypothetical protein
MVTRRVEPAAFVEGVGVTFTVIADFDEILRVEDDPLPGHVPIGQGTSGKGEGQV